MKNFCPAVSVVIPFYNAEKFIGECLDSLLAQTFQNFEVIIEDDCSTDLSYAIVQSYAEKFGGRLILSRMEKNSGSGALPRNRGLYLSRGEYIAFADNDDLFTPTALEELYTLATDYDADVVYCDKHYLINADGSNLQIGSGADKFLVEEPTFETDNLAQRYQKILQDCYRIPQWRKFVRRKLIFERELFFPNTRHADDVIWTYGLVFHAQKFLRVPNVTYIHRRRENSIMYKARTPQQAINFWLNPVFLGVKALDKLLARHEFFQANPQYRYGVLEKFIDSELYWLYQCAAQLSPFEVYDALKQEYGDKFGEYDVLIPALCAALNTQQKNHCNAELKRKD